MIRLPPAAGREPAAGLGRPEARSGGPSRPPRLTRRRPGSRDQGASEKKHQLGFSLPNWSFGVPGRPKCWAMRAPAMNRAVAVEAICGPLSETASITGTRSSLSDTTPCASSSSSASSSRCSLPSATRARGEGDLGLCGGLLRGDHGRQPLAGHHVDNCDRAAFARPEVHEVVDPYHAGNELGPLRERPLLAAPPRGAFGQDDALGEHPTAPWTR